MGPFAMPHRNQGFTHSQCFSVNVTHISLFLCQKVNTRNIIQIQVISRGALLSGLPYPGGFIIASRQDLRHRSPFGHRFGTSPQKTRSAPSVHRETMKRRAVCRCDLGRCPKKTHFGLHKNWAFFTILPNILTCALKTNNCSPFTLW